MNGRQSAFLELRLSLMDNLSLCEISTEVKSPIVKINEGDGTCTMFTVSSRLDLACVALRDPKFEKAARVDETEYL